MRSSKTDKIHDVLGYLGECKVTGLKGMITGVLEDVAGSIQYMIEPKKSFLGTIEPGYSVDYQQVKVTRNDNKRLTVTEAQPKFALGEMVAGTIVDVKGVVVTRIRYLNGCIRCTVQPFDTMKNDDRVSVFEANLMTIQDEPDYADRRDNRVTWNATGAPIKLAGVEEEETDASTEEPKVDRSPKRTGGPSQRISDL